MGFDCRKLTRREVLAGGALALAAPALIIPGRAKASDGLVVANWGGPIADMKKRVYYDPFTEKTGIPITVVTGPDFAKVVTQVQADDVEWDVVDVTNVSLPRGIRMELFEPIDEQIVDRSEVLPVAKGQYSISDYLYAGGIGFATNGRSNAPSDPPQNWVDFFDVDKFPGRRGLRSKIGETLEIALMGDGVPASEVYPCDIDRAFKALDRIKPHIDHWIGAQAQTVTLIEQNELDFDYMYSNQAMTAQNSGLNIGYSRQQNILGLSYTVVLRGSRNKEAAMRLLNHIVSRDSQIAMTNQTGMAPLIQGVMNDVDPKVRSWLPDPMDKNNVITDIDWWAEHEEELGLRFKEWLQV